MAGPFKYAAFISYSHKDKAWGEKLHRALERYRVPKRLRGLEGRDGPVGERIFPVFRDREELPSSSDLNEQIALALRDSATLIVICSRNAAASRWVNEEVRMFKAMGRAGRIVALIIDGVPNADASRDASPDDECFPEALRYRVGADGALTADRVEPVAADVRADADGEENARLKVIAGVLGIGFAQLKQRDLEAQRSRLRRIVAMASAVTISLAALLVLSMFYARQARDERNRALRSLGDSYAERARGMVRAGQFDAATRLAVVALRLSEATSELAAVVLRQAGAQIALRARFPLNVDEQARAVLSPDHRLIATPVGHDVLIWRAGPSELMVTLSGHSANVRTVSFSPDGARMVTASDDGTAGVWDVSTGARVAVLKFEQDDIFDARFWRDGRNIVTGGRQGTIAVWDALTHRRLAAVVHMMQQARIPGEDPEPPVGYLSAIDVAADGRRILGVAHSVALYDYDGASTLNQRELTVGGVDEARLSADGKWAVVGNRVGGFQLFNAETGGEVDVEQEYVSGTFALSGDGRLAHWAEDTVYVFDLETLGREVVARDLEVPVTAIRFAPAGQRWIAFGREDGRIDVFERSDSGDWSRYKTFAGHASPVTHLDFTYGGTLVSSSLDGTAREWVLKDRQPLELSVVEDAGAAKLPDGRSFVPAGRPFLVERRAGASTPDADGSSNGGRTVIVDGQATIKDASTGAIVTLQRSAGVVQLAWSPDGAAIAGAVGPAGVVVWDSKTGARIREIPSASGSVQSVHFSHDGTRLVSRTEEHHLEVRAQDGALLFASPASTPVLTFALSPAAPYLLAGGDDGVVQLIDMSSGQVKNTFTHGRTLTSREILYVTFSPDGNSALSTGDDKMVRVWDVRSGSSLLTEPLTGKWLTSCVGFLPGSREVMVSGADGTRIVDIGTREILLVLPQMYSCPEFTADKQFALGKPAGDEGFDGGAFVLWDTSRLTRDVPELLRRACDLQLPSTARTFTKAEADRDLLIHNLRLDSAGREIDVCTGKAR